MKANSSAARNLPTLASSKTFLALAGLFFCLAFSPFSYPQSAPKNHGNAPKANPAIAPIAPISPDAALQSFEPPIQTEYRLGDGDELDLDVAGRPELQKHLIVGPDGSITLPLIGEIKLDGLTRKQASAAIETELKKFYIEPAVTVTVTRYTANRVTLLGAVQRPGLLSFDTQPTLLGAITRGGVVTGSTGKAADIPERCAIYRTESQNGATQILWVNIRKLVESGSNLANMRLQTDDVVFVPSPDERYISVLGRVAHPGAIPLTDQSTIASLLAAAGGLSNEAGGNPRLQLFDPATGKKSVIAYRDLLRANPRQQPQLTAGSILYVPESGIAKVGYVLQQFAPLAEVGAILVLPYLP